MVSPWRDPGDFNRSAIMEFITVHRALVTQTALWFALCSGFALSQEVNATKRQLADSGLESVIKAAKRNAQMCEALNAYWMEESFENAGKTLVEKEHHPVKGMIPVDVRWCLSSDKTASERRVLRANTEVVDGDLRLGMFRVDTTKTPNWITFERDGHLIGGIFEIEGDALTIALPRREWDHQRRTYCVGKRPESFVTAIKNKTPWKVSISDDVTVYRLVRHSNKHTQKK